MNEFILGFLSAVVIMLFVLPLLSKVLMRMFMKNKINRVANTVMYKLNKLGSEFKQIDDGQQEEDKSLTIGTEGV